MWKQQGLSFLKNTWRSKFLQSFFNFIFGSKPFPSLEFSICFRFSKLLESEGCSPSLSSNDVFFPPQKQPATFLGRSLIPSPCLPDVAFSYQGRIIDLYQFTKVFRDPFKETDHIHFQLVQVVARDKPQDEKIKE